jgi:hypothetical protein
MVKPNGINAERKGTVVWEIMKVERNGFVVRNVGGKNVRI